MRFRIFIVLLPLLLVPCVIWGATYYVDQDCNDCADYDPNNGCGDGSYQCYDRINEGVDACTSDGDILIIQPATYTYANGNELDYNGIDADNVVIMGADPNNTILDFNESGDLSGWLYAVNKDGCIVKDLTIKNAGMNQVLNFTDIGSGGDHDFIIENITFINCNKRCIYFKNGTGEHIRYNTIKGTRQTVLNSSNSCIVFENTSADVYYNIIMPSTDYKPMSIYLTGDPNDTVNFYNNLIIGGSRYGIYFKNSVTSTIKNNIIFGNGATDGVDGSTNVYNECANVTADYNLTLPPLEDTRDYDGEIIPGSHEVNDIPRFRGYPRKAYINIGLDHGEEFVEDLQGLMEEFGWKMTWFLNVQNWIEDADTYNSKMADYVNNGHEVACHSWAHSNMEDYGQPLMTVTYAGGGTEEVFINTNIPDVADYSGWTGSIKLADSLTKSFLDSNNDFITVGELMVWINQQCGWSSAIVDSGILNADILAITLSDTNIQVGSGGQTFGVTRDVYLYSEVEYAKDKLETAIDAAVGGGSYTVKSFGMPYHDCNGPIFPVLVDANYVIVRGDAGEIGSSEWDLTNFSRYSTWYAGMGNFVDPNTGDLLEGGLGKILFLAAQGGFMSICVHYPAFDTDEKVGWLRSFFAVLQELETINAVEVMSYANFGDYLLSNSTVLEGTGINERRKMTFTDNSDFTLQLSSPCIDTGVILDGQYKFDFSGSGQLNDNYWDIGPYRYKKYDDGPLIEYNEPLIENNDDNQEDNQGCFIKYLFFWL